MILFGLCLPLALVQSSGCSCHSLWVVAFRLLVQSAGCTCHSLRLWLWYIFGMHLPQAVPATAVAVTAFGLWLSPQPSGCAFGLRRAVPATALGWAVALGCHSLWAVALVSSSGCTATARRFWAVALAQSSVWAAPATALVVAVW